MHLRNAVPTVLGVFTGRYPEAYASNQKAKPDGLLSGCQPLRFVQAGSAPTQQRSSRTAEAQPSGDRPTAGSRRQLLTNDTE